MVDDSLRVQPLEFAPAQASDRSELGPMAIGCRTRGLGVALAAAMLAGTLPPLANVAAAQETPARKTASLSPAEQQRAEYERISREMSLSDEKMKALTAEIAAVRKDSVSITAALVQSAKTERKLSQDIEEIGGRIQLLNGRKGEIARSLAARRDVLAEVLGALQRMGLNPPPALLVRPEDALSSVRSAILLGAVVPELRAQTEVLVADLAELSKVAASIEAERDRLAAAVSGQVAEKERLSLLLAEKQRIESEGAKELLAEQERSEELAARSKSLKELIASLEQQAATAEAARRRAEAERLAAPVPRDNRLAGHVDFARLKGTTPLPASGAFLRRFGAADGNGGVMLGDTLATQSGAIVTAPSDGSVLYAGPFRSYGQLLILNAGDGYHVVLAGMSRINVALGQSVLAGEPVGAMGEARVADASASSGGIAAPELYVEFRKDGKPVDPAPWWADRFSGRTGNGT